VKTSLYVSTCNQEKATPGLEIDKLHIMIANFNAVKNQNNSLELRMEQMLELASLLAILARPLLAC